MLLSSFFVGGSVKTIFQAIAETDQPLVLATVVRTKGSVPRHAGTKMLIYPDGSIMGTVGGGEMESRVIERASHILTTRHPEVMTFQLTDPSRGDPGVCGGQAEIFMEPILPDPTLLIIGAGHCGQALAEAAKWVGFRVIITDDRAELCNPQAIPEADEHIVTAPKSIADEVPIHEQTYIAAVTRGVPLDVAMLPALLHSPAPYIGVMGSQRRWATAHRQLIENGVSEADLARIHSPIGLELNAETPREIAISILAEIIAHQRQATYEES